MNHINGKAVIGAPRSEARYQNANTVCLKCLFESPPSFWFRALLLKGKPGMSEGQCYVCEELKRVASLGPDADTCGEDCGHTDAEHECFDIGVRAGELGFDAEDYPLWWDEDQVEAWQFGHAVGVLNRRPRG